MKPVHLKIETVPDGKGGQFRMWRARHVSKMRSALALSPTEAVKVVMKDLSPVELAIQGYRCGSKCEARCAMKKRYEFEKQYRNLEELENILKQAREIISGSTGFEEPKLYFRPIMGKPSMEDPCANVGFFTLWFAADTAPVDLPVV